VNFEDKEGNYTMKNKKLIIVISMVMCASIISFIPVNKNVHAKEKISQPQSIKENSCFALDKQIVKAWRDLNLTGLTTGYLYPAKENNKWGFIDSRGKYKILPKYDFVTLFSPSGIAVVGSFDKGKNHISAKIINKNGGIVLDGILIDGYVASFPDNNNFFDNYFDVFKLKIGKSVIVNHTGKIIYSTMEELGSYSEGFVAEGNSAYIDVSKLIEGKTNYRIKMTKKYNHIGNFSHEYAELDTNDEKIEYIDENGKIYKNKPKGYVDTTNESEYLSDGMHYGFYTCNQELLDDGYKINKKEDSESTGAGISTLGGKELLSAKYGGIKYLGEGMFAIGWNTGFSEYHKNECEFIFDARKIKLYKVHFYMLQRYCNGVATASNLTSSFFIDREGKRVREYPTFDKVGKLTRIGGLIMHSVHGKVSYYLKSGAVIYLEKNSRTILSGKIGYNSVSTYKRYDFGLEYPQLFGIANTSAQGRINDSVKKMNEEIFKIISKDESGEDYDVYYDQLDVSLIGNLLMVKYRVITNGGGTLCLPYIMSKYYDVRTGQTYELSAMFKKGTSYKKELVTMVAELYDHKKLLELLWSKGDLNELKDYLLDGNFYIDKAGIIISEFPDGSTNHLISYEELKIPYSHIISMINTKSELWNSFKKATK
jgi:hypothetical protein